MDNLLRQFCGTDRLIRFADRHLVGNLEGYSTHGRVILKWSLKIIWDSVDLSHLAQDRAILNCYERGEKPFTEKHDVL